MNIIFPIGSFYPSQQGGPCNSVYSLAKGLVRAGAQVCVVTTDYDISSELGIPLNQWTKIDNIEVYYMRMPLKDNAILRHPLFFLTKRQQWKDVLAQRPCDVLHANMLYTIQSHMAAAYAKERNIPLVWTTHGSLLSYAFSRGRLKKKLFLSLPWVKRGLTGCHFHVTSEEEENCIKKFMKEYTGESLDGRIYNIPILFDDTVFMPGDDVPLYPYKYVLYLSRIHTIKRLEHLIAAFAAAKLPEEIRLVIAGWTGENLAYTKMLKGLVEKLDLQERVIFTERRMEGRDKATLYRHAEVFVLPSESENFGLVVLESLAQGVPVIASNKTPWEVLEKRGAGFWVPNDPASLAESLNKFFSLNSEERKRLSVNATTLAREYNNDALIERYIRMYESIVHRP